MKLIFIDAGHGLSNKDQITPDNGAVGIAIERTEVVEIAREVIRLLAAQKFTEEVRIIPVGVETRMSLEQKRLFIVETMRVAGANTVNSRLVSIHCNSGGGEGVETLYRGDGGVTYSAFAKTVNDAVVEATGFKNRGVKADSVTSHKRLGILRDNQALGCLVECGFVDSVHNARILQDPLLDDSFATGIVKGIMSNLGMPFSPVIPVDGFSDVPEGQWFTDAVKWGNANGLMKGYNDGTFRPHQPITRAEFITVLKRYAEKPTH